MSQTYGRVLKDYGDEITRLYSNRQFQGVDILEMDLDKLFDLQYYINRLSDANNVKDIENTSVYKYYRTEYNIQSFQLSRKLQSMRLTYPYFGFPVIMSTSFESIFSETYLTNPSNDNMIDINNIQNKNDVLDSLFLQFVIIQLIPDLKFIGQYYILELPDPIVLGYKLRNGQYIYIRSKYILHIPNEHITAFSFMYSGDKVEIGDTSGFKRFIENLSNFFTTLGFNEQSTIDDRYNPATIIGTMMEYDEDNMNNFMMNVMSYKKSSSKSEIISDIWSNTRAGNKEMSENNINEFVYNSLTDFIDIYSDMDEGRTTEEMVLESDVFKPSLSIYPDFLNYV